MAVHAELSRIIDAAEGESVIARDHAVGILIKLASIGAYASEATTLLMAQLRTRQTNQLPMYAEIVFPIISEANKASFVRLLRSRLPKIPQPSKRKRVEKVLAKLDRGQQAR